MRFINNTKSAVKSMNNIKNKLNNKINWQKISYPNAT